MNEKMAASSVPASHLALLVSFCELENIRVGPILRAERIQPELMQNSTSVLSALQYTRILLNVDAEVADESFWFRFGQYMDFPAYGPLGQALLSCANIREALALLCRYYPVIGCGSVLTVGSAGGDLSVTIESGDAYESRKNRLKNELIISLIFNGIKKFDDNDFEAVRFEFSYSAPVLPYNKYLNSHCKFSCPTTRIIIPQKYLPLPGPHANPVMLKILAKECDQLLDQLAAQETLVPKVKSLIAAVADHYPTINMVAGQLGLGERTLSRQLKEEGTNYRNLLAEVKIQKAISLLRHTAISVEEVAHKVGFSNSANFRKALLASIGLTPSAVRRQGRSDS